MSEIPDSSFQNILWRSELRDQLVQTICNHHEQVYGAAFERRVGKKCCNIFGKHKKGSTVQVQLYLI